jgi:hypothetical protein
MKKINLILNSFSLLLYTICATSVFAVCNKAFGGFGGAMLMTVGFISLWYIVYAFLVVFSGPLSGFLNIFTTLLLCYFMIFSESGPYTYYSVVPQMAAYYAGSDRIPGHAPFERLNYAKHAIKSSYDEYGDQYDNFSRDWESTVKWFSTHSGQMPKEDDVIHSLDSQTKENRAFKLRMKIQNRLIRNEYSEDEAGRNKKHSDESYLKSVDPETAKAFGIR